MAAWKLAWNRGTRKHFYMWTDIQKEERAREERHQQIYEKFDRIWYALRINKMKWFPSPELPEQFVASAVPSFIHSSNSSELLLTSQNENGFLVLVSHSRFDSRRQTDFNDGFVFFSSSSFFRTHKHTFGRQSAFDWKLAANLTIRWHEYNIKFGLNFFD